MEEFQMLQELRAAVASKLDVSDDVDTAALVEGVRSPEMNGASKATRMTTLSSGTQETAKKFDVDGTGGFSRANLTSILRAHSSSVKESNRMKKILCVAVALLVLMFAGMFLLSYLAIDMAKEMRAGDSGIMYTSDGTVARVGSSDFDVSEDGTLVCNKDKVSAMDSGSRRLTESQAVVATEEVASERMLHAALPDAYFESLKKVTAHSPKGHHLSLNVMGFARVPVLNSRCGNIVYLFTAWGPRLSLDSFDLSFDAELGDMFKNAGFEILVGGVNGRRLASADVSIAGLFNHISSMEDSGSWTCGEVPLPVITEFYYHKFTQYLPCSAPMPDGKKSSVDECDSKYGGQYPSVVPLPAEHQTAVMDRVERIKYRLGHDMSDLTELLYFKQEIVTMRSPSYHVSRTRVASHPGNEKVSVLNHANVSARSFQWFLNGAAGNRFYCENEQNVTDMPEFKISQMRNQSVDTTMHFEYVGLEVVNGKIYRHFRMMPAEDFLAYMAENVTESAKEKSSWFHIWDDADTLEPFRILSPEAGLIVFSEALSDLTDEEVLVNLMRFENGSANATDLVDPFSSCLDEEEDGWADDSEFNLKVPQMDDGPADLDDFEIEFYMRMLADPEQEDAALDLEDPDWGLKSLEWTTHSDDTYSFARYAIRSRGFFAIADACREGCPTELAALESYVVQNGDGAFCGSPALGEVVTCLLGLDRKTTTFCEESRIMTEAEKCFSDSNESNATMAGERRLGELDIEILPDGTRRFDLGQLSTQTKASLMRETGLDAFSGQVFLHFNESDAAALQENEGAIIEYHDPRGLVTTSRRLTTEWRWCGATMVCWDISWPNGCGGFNFMRKRYMCRFAVSVQIGVGAKLKGAISIAAVGAVDIAKMFPVIPPTVYGEAYASGMVEFSLVRSCKHWPFTLLGEVEIGFRAGIDLWLFRIQLFRIAIAAGVKTSGAKKATGRQIYIGSSGSNTRCVHVGEHTACQSNAGNRGIRKNWDHWHAGDTFDVTSNGHSVCARRLDWNGGWGMGLKVECYTATREVYIGNSGGNMKCVYHVGSELQCPSNSGDRYHRVNGDHWHAGDRFDITVSTSHGGTVCAKRLDWGGGWGMRLKIKCADSGLPECDFEVYGRVELQVLLLKGVLQGSYFIRSELWRVTFMLKFYVPALWWGWWETIGNWVIMEKHR